MNADLLMVRNESINNNPKAQQAQISADLIPHVVAEDIDNYFLWMIGKLYTL